MDPFTIFKKRIQYVPTNVSPFELREWLSKNPALTMDMVLYDIQTNPKYKHAWKFKHLAHIIPVEQLVENNILPYPNDLDSSYNMFHMKISINTLLKTHSQLDYEWGSLTENPNITLEDIQAHPELPWDYNFIMFNPNLEYKHIEGYFKPYLNESVFYFLSFNATYEQIMKNPNAKWLNYVLGSKYILKEHIPHLLTFFPEKPLPILFRSACLNPNLTFDDLIELFGEELSLKEAHTLTSFTFSHFKKYFLSKKKLPITQFHDILPITFIKEYPSEPWDWFAIIQYNKTITYDQFDEIPKNIFPDMSVELNECNIRKILFDNKYISHFDKKCILEDLLKSPITDLHIIVSPLFLEPTFEEIKEYFAKKRMIRLIVEVMTNPTYLQCRKRLTREYCGLYGSSTNSSILKCC